MCVMRLCKSCFASLSVEASGQLLDAEFMKKLRNKFNLAGKPLRDFLVSKGWTLRVAHACMCMCVCVCLLGCAYVSVN